MRIYENPKKQAHNLKVVGSNPTPATNFTDSALLAIAVVAGVDCRNFIRKSGATGYRRERRCGTWACFIVAKEACISCI